MKADTVLFVIILIIHCNAQRVLPGWKEQSKLKCKLFSTMDGHRFSKTKVTIRPLEDQPFTQEFIGGGYMETFLACRYDGRSFGLFHFLSIGDNLTCTCQTSYCDADTAVIEQSLQEKSWQEVSTLKRYYDDQFEISALTTLFNSSIYRCVVPYASQPTGRTNSDLDRYMIAGGFIMLSILLLSHFLMLLRSLLKHRSQAVAVNT